MCTNSQHSILRHPEISWAELRLSVNSNTCYRPHTHTQYSLGVVDSGQAIFHHPDGPHQVRAGTVVLIEPHVIHACNPLPNQNWSYRMLFVDANWLHHQVSGSLGRSMLPAGLAFTSRCHEDATVAHMINALCQAFSAESVPKALVSKLVLWVASQARISESGAVDSSSPELAPALAVIHSEFAGRVMVNELADACGMSNSQFIRHFRSVLGTTPGAYIQNLRINGARKLLSQGMTLAETAGIMGFADQAHMQRAFKAHFAMTPGDYKKAR